MSQFLTEIPVDIEAVKRLLPKNSFIEGVTWNKETQKVELTWSNHKLRTPYNIPTPFAVQELHDQQLPKCVTVRAEASAPPTSGEPPQANAETPLTTREGVNTVTDNVKVVDVKPKRGVKKQ